MCKTVDNFQSYPPVFNTLSTASKKALFFQFECATIGKSRWHMDVTIVVSPSVRAAPPPWPREPQKSPGGGASGSGVDQPLSHRAPPQSPQRGAKDGAASFWQGRPAPRTARCPGPGMGRAKDGAVSEVAKDGPARRPQTSYRTREHWPKR